MIKRDWSNFTSMDRLSVFAVFSLAVIVTATLAGYLQSTF